jgi:exosome complex component CSL4
VLKVSTPRRSVRVAPGEKVAVIEEFDAGEGTYLSDGAVRSRSLGSTTYDLKRRLVKIRPARPIDRIPSPGDEVIGQVETFQSNVINARIQYINDKRSQANFTGMAIVRPFGGRMGRGRIPVCKPGDIIKAKVVSNKNAIIHLSVDEDSCGVLHTVCSLCGGDVMKNNNNRIKCVECGFIDDRKLASSFGNIALA